MLLGRIVAQDSGHVKPSREIGSQMQLAEYIYRNSATACKIKGGTHITTFITMFSNAESSSTLQVFMFITVINQFIHRQVNRLNLSFFGYDSYILKSKREILITLYFVYEKSTLNRQ